MGVVSSNGNAKDVVPKKLIMDVLRENLTHDPMLPEQADASLSDHKQLLLLQNSVWRHTDNLEMISQGDRDRLSVRARTFVINGRKCFPSRFEQYQGFF